MNCTQIDLNQVVARQEKTLRRLLGEGTAVKVTCAAPPALVCADEGMMAQILFSLATQGGATGSSPRELTIQTEPFLVDDVHARLQPGARPGEFIRLSVTTSVAAPPECAGRDLALPVIAGILHRRHGWFEVTRHEGVTTSSCFLPKASPLESAGTPWCEEHVLLVEDESDMREMLGMILRRASYDVVEAEDGLHALELWTEQRAAVSLLITDMVMPRGISGRQLAQRLRATKPELGVIYTSGYELAADARGDCEDGTVRFLQKPYDAIALLETVQQALSRPANCSTA
jgi:two-component system, cell cycle sensor histidine kinase and response regulator CckA